MKAQKVLVIGSGGREHALAWRISRDSDVAETIVAPGNPGMERDAKLRVVSLAISDATKVIEFVRANSVDFVVIGPDQALADGLADALADAGILAFGPKKAAARIEWSKAFAKDCMQAAGIPTARFSVFTDAKAAKAFLRASPWTSGWALKADGLALGKGVVVTQDLAEAEATIEEFMVAGNLGAAGKTLVIEERLEGRELSSFFLCDGKTARPLANACDYKQLLDDAKGPNTGGMGAFAPADWLPADFTARVQREVVEPLLHEMQKRGVPFSGTLFIGLMVTKDGPRVIEFNARFGDPETQAILPLLDGNFTEALRASAEGRLASLAPETLRLKRNFAVHVVLAAEGYPGTGGKTVAKGDPLEIPQDIAENHDDLERGRVFYAGVGKQGSTLVSAGGRVLGLTALGKTRAEARARAYEQFSRLRLRGGQFRQDVGR